MNVLLRWLIDHVWVLYVGCAIGALIYLVRALAAQREQSLAMFTLEHESATTRAVRAWIMVFLFIACSLLIFMGTRFVQASFPGYDGSSPSATQTPSSGLNPPTPGADDTTVTPTAEVEPPTALPATEPVETEEPPTPMATPLPLTTPTATTVAEGPLSGSVSVRFGDFGELTGWELSSAEVTAGTPFVLTLYWRGLEGESPTDYTVFTHLLSPQGELLAQHDGPPAGGSRGTSQWDAGETIVDSHQLTFTPEASDYAGSASLIVGLYDPGDIDARVVTNEGQDYVALPATVNVTAE